MTGAIASAVAIAVAIAGAIVGGIGAAIAIDIAVANEVAIAIAIAIVDDAALAIHPGHRDSNRNSSSNSRNIDNTKAQSNDNRPSTILIFACHCCG